MFFADLRTLDGLATLRQQLAASALTLEWMADITDNVLAAMRLDSDRKVELIRSFIPRGVRGPGSSAPRSWLCGGGLRRRVRRGLWSGCPLRSSWVAARE